MKKIFIIIAMIILISGCTNKDKLNKELESITNTYYNEYIKDKVAGLDTLEISLGDLRELKSSKLNLSKLDKCSDDTKIKATIKNEKITDYEISLICK